MTDGRSSHGSPPPAGLGGIPARTPQGVQFDVSVTTVGDELPERRLGDHVLVRGRGGPVARTSYWSARSSRLRPIRIRQRVSALTLTPYASTSPHWSPTRRPQPTTRRLQHRAPLHITAGAAARSPLDASTTHFSHSCKPALAQKFGSASRPL